MINHAQRFLNTFFNYAEQRGQNAEHLAKISGIDISELDTPLKKRQIDNLWKNVSELTKDPIFGLHLGESMQISALGIVGEIIQNSNKVGQALERAADYLGLITDVFSMEIKRFEKMLKIKFIPDPFCMKSYPFTTKQTIDLSIVITIYELKGLIFKRIQPMKVTFDRKYLHNTNEYERILGCKPLIHSEGTELIFEGDLWDLKIAAPNSELLSILMEKANELIQQLPEKPSLTNQVKKYLLANCYLGIPTLEDVAANFNISPRTLQRKLNKENTSFLEISDNIRKQIALHYVRVENRSIKETSHLLGYNETSAFTRAFKRWTGRTPAVYQSN